MAKKHISGKQRRGEHTTLIDAAEPLIKLLRKVPDVGISPGLIDSKARSGTGGTSIKFTATDRGLLVQVTGARYVQKVNVICGNRKRGLWVFRQIEQGLGRAFNRVIPPA